MKHAGIVLMLACLTARAEMAAPSEAGLIEFRARLALYRNIYASPADVVAAMERYFPGRRFSAVERKDGSILYAVHAGDGLSMAFYFELN